MCDAQEVVSRTVDRPAWAAKFWNPSAEKEGPARALALLESAAAEVLDHVSRQSGQVLQIRGFAQLPLSPGRGIVATYVGLLVLAQFWKHSRWSALPHPEIERQKTRPVSLPASKSSSARGESHQERPPMSRG